MVHIRKLIKQNFKRAFYITAIISNFCLVILLCNLTLSSHAQNATPPSVNIGDMAPPLRVREWIKGTPVQQFEKGKVYVVEFWATWCKPCIAAMPHLSTLAAKYKDRVTILGIDIYEQKSTSLAKVKAFVDSMGHQMNYHVAIQDSDFMAVEWMDASGYRGIPSSFVVNAEGRLAWIGHPKDLEKILPKIVNNTWDTKDALNKRNLAQYLEKLNDSVYYELYKFMDDRLKPGDLGQPDSILLTINKIIKSEPNLRYAPVIVYNTFSSLLKTNQQMALEFGHLAIVKPSYDDEPAYRQIIGAIEEYSDKLNLSTEIYQLGAEAYQAYIDQIPYPEIVNTPKLYHKMATLYWRANEQSKAIETEQKAIEKLKGKKDFSKTDLAAFEAQLQQYKNK